MVPIIAIAFLLNAFSMERSQRNVRTPPPPPFFYSAQCCIYVQTDCLTIEWYSCSNFITHKVQSNYADSVVQSIFIVSEWTYVWLSATVQRAHTTGLSNDCIFKRQFLFN